MGFLPMLMMYASSNDLASGLNSCVARTFNKEGEKYYHLCSSQEKEIKIKRV